MTLGMHRSLASVWWAVLAIAMGGCASEPPAPLQPPLPNSPPAAEAPAKVKRSLAVRRAFQRLYPCPVNGKPRGACPGYVVDHVVPLACGGPDAINNLQWQTREEAKAKDRWERQECR
jgi:hypothetical protein